ncbi:MAG: rhamnulokinase [Lachnospiraceae bacterium]|jgi:rhamnulokinase|nr:rhamnulokinase [Lachnospiraceae bacterium]
MGNYYLAIDIGASSGRHILGHLKNGKMELEEIYRFENGLKEKNGHLCWNHDRLFQEILSGIKKCKELGKIPVSLGIDTWGVDFVLLDKEDRLLGDTVGYRDGRTKGMDQKVYEMISEEDLYARTGIQKAIFNTIYQLMAIKTEDPRQMEQAGAMLMTPDYFHFLLTGVKMQEYTNATTGQLVNPETKDWDYELIDMLGYNREMFLPIHTPGTIVGCLKKEIQDLVGFDCQVVLPGTHDTASAVLSVPANDDDFLYISSGTWSLMGIETMEANCSPKSKTANITNEGGYGYRFRYLKNIMGLWMIQNVKKELKDAYSFAQLCDMASECDSFPSRVDVDDDCFLAPKSMIEQVRQYCRNTGQKEPNTPGEIAAVIYNSLGESYARTAEEIETIMGRTYGRIHVVGGGANAEYLNQLTAKYTGKEVHAGPTEATAIGNLTAQMIKAGEFASVEEARSCIYDSFEIKQYEA